MNIGVNSEFEYKEILFKGTLSYDNNSLNLIAELKDSQETFKEILRKISNEFYSLINNFGLVEILDFKLESLILAKYKNCEYFLVSIEGGIFGIQIDSNVSVFLGLDFEKAQFAILTDIFNVVKNLVTIKNITFAFSSGNLGSMNNNFVKDLISIDEKSFKQISDKSKSKNTSIELSRYVNYINGSKFLLVSGIEFNKDSLLGKVLGNGLSTELNMIIAVTDSEVKALLLLELDIENTLNLTGCLFIKSTGTIGMDGQVTLFLDKEPNSLLRRHIIFSVNGIITFDSISISGTYNNIIDFGGIRIENLGIAIGYSAEEIPVFGVKANLFIPSGKSDFHTFFCIYYDNENSMISGAISDISITSIIEYLTNSSVNMSFEILKIGALVPSVQGKRQISKEDLENKNFHKISEIFKEDYFFDLPSVSKKDYLSIQIDKDSRDDTIWYLSDNVNAKHYIIKNGVPSIEAQFYLSTTEMKFGEYNIYPGIFLACRLIIMDKIKINTLVDVNINKGIRILINLNEIDLGFLKIKKSDKETVFMKKIDPPSMLKQFVDENNSGPLFYLSTYVDEMALFISSHIEVCGLIKADALIKFQGRTFLFNIEYDFFGMKTIIGANADFENLWAGSFEVSFVIDVNEFYNTFNEITNEVSSFFKNKVKDIQALIDKVKEAENNLSTYDREIWGKESEIQNLRNSINNTPWYQAYMIPYYLGQIAFIGTEILAIEGYKEAQRLILEAAQGALELAKGTASSIGSIIDKMSSVVNWSVHLNRLEMSVGNAKKLDELAFHFMIDCTFLGKNEKYELNASLNIGDIIASIAKAAKDYIIDKLKNIIFTNSNELPSYQNINRAPFILEIYNENLGDSNEYVKNTLSLVNKVGEIYKNIYQYECHEHNDNLIHLKTKLNTHKYNLNKIQDYYDGLKIQEGIKEIQEDYKNNLGNSFKKDDYSKFDILQEQATQAQDILKKVKENENLKDIEELLYKQNNSYDNKLVNGNNEDDDKAFNILQLISSEAEKIEKFNEGIFYELMGDAYKGKNDRNSAKLQYSKAIDIYKIQYDDEKIDNIKILYKKSIEKVQEKIQSL